MNDNANEEFFEAFQKLTRQEKMLIEVFANRCIRGTPFSCSNDLIHEVIIKVMDGKRHWPRDVDLAVFIASSIRSVASNSRKKSESFNINLDDLDEDRLGGARSQYEPVMSAEDVALLNERKAITHKAAKFAKATLRSDEEGLQVLEGLLAGLEPKEMCAAFGLNAASFKAARQRVMTRLKLFGQRNPI